MKFDYSVFNPPYQETNQQNQRAKPLYNLFMDEAQKVSSKVEVIHPARFLFNAGQTPKKWNEKMLNDEHFKVLRYEPIGSNIFPNTDIKGGVAITYWDSTKDFGKIGVFTSEPILNNIVKLITKHIQNEDFSSLAHPKSQFGFNEQLYIEHPNFKNRLTKGNEYIVDASIFDKIPELFIDSPKVKENYIYVHGRQNNQRKGYYILKTYVKNSEGVDKYKVFVTGANGSGKFGEPLSTPFIGLPNEIGTQTYMSFGFFNTQEEADGCLKYIKCKFTRTLLSVLKVTQNNPRGVWAYIPLQDFTSNSDIDWSKSIPEIDQQLYRKYGLSEEEINFIETNVKEMN